MKLIKLVGALFLTAVSMQARAAIVLVNLEVGSSVARDVAINPITLSAGDTLDLSVTRTGGGPLTVHRPHYFFAGVFGQPSVWTLSTSYEFDDLHAVVTPASGFTNLVSGLGVYASTPYQVREYGDVSFTRFRQRITIVSGPTQVFTRATFVTGEDVPEPATWLMLFAGFGMLGYAARLHKRRIAPII